MNARLKKYSFALACLLAPAAGCGDSSSGNTSNLTYWNDIAPLLNDKCVACHQPGGIGPFSMLNYSDVAPKAASIATMTKAKMMPPYLVTHDGTCGQFEDAAALTQAEIDKLQAWAGSPLVEGTKQTLMVPAIRHLEQGTDYKTPSIVPVAAGTAIALNDDYRCFEVETKLAKDQFITGYEVLPGNASIVHHMLAFVVDPARMTRLGKTNSELIQALDKQDPDRVGWTCFGGAGDGVEDEATPVVWAPGQGVITFPEGVGIRQRPTDKLVIQIHYNLADLRTRGQMDSSVLRFRYADKVDRAAAFLTPDGLLESLFTKPTPDMLPKGKPLAPYTFTKTMAEMGLEGAPPLEVIGVMPHMHERGRTLQMNFLGAGSQDDCMARVNNWNFHWQKYYFYKTPRPVLTPESKVRVTCEYDTSKDMEDVKPGWGTNNEMCLTTLIVTEKK